MIFEDGDLRQQSYLASVRKSVLAMLEDLGMDDEGGLLAGEKKAKVRHLITARSGVFHPASYPGDDLAQAPPRGTQKPGDYHLYSNWDFNAAATSSRN